MNYLDLTGPAGQDDNMGGTTQLAYFAPVSTFVASTGIKKPISVPVVPADLVEIVSAHAFSTGNCFKKIYCTMNKGSFEADPQGEIDGRSLKQKGTIFLPGTESNAHAFAAMVKNDNGIWLFEMPDSSSKGYLQIGTEMFPAKVSPKFTTGTNESGIRGYNFDIETVSPRQYIYKSTISLTPAP